MSTELRDADGEPLGEYTFSTRFCVAWIGDNWKSDTTQNEVEDWEILVDLERDQLVDALAAFVAADPHWRPISVCGYAYAYDSIFQGGEDNLPDYEAVRYAVVLVRDNIDDSQWELQPELTFEKLKAALDESMAAGRMPISVTSWRTNLGGDPPGWVREGHEGNFQSNQRWSLLTVEDRSKDGVSAVPSGAFQWEMVPAFTAGNRVTELKLDARPLCIAPFTAVDLHNEPTLTFERDYDVGNMWMLVVYRAHPPRYWRVTWDTAFEPPELVPATLALQADPNAVVEDPYKRIDAYVAGLMVTNRVNTMCWAVSLKNNDVAAVRGYTWAPEGFPTSYPNAKFRAGSVAKDLLSTALHKHCQDNGGYDLDAPFFPEYCQNLFACLNPGYSGPQFATFDSLLRHDGDWTKPTLANQGGYVRAQAWLGQAYPVERASYLSFMLQLPDGLDPAKLWDPAVVAGSGVRNYSNFGYELLTDFLASRLADRDVDRYQREEILEPLGAFDTQWGFASRWQHLPGEVVGTPDASSVPSKLVVEYLDDGLSMVLPGVTLPTDPFAPPNAMVGSIVRPPLNVASPENDDQWLEPATVTEGYGGWVAVGSIVQGSGATVTTALDMLRLVRALRNWEQPGFPQWGMQTDDGEEILSTATVNAMLNRTGAAGWGANLFQLRGWNAYAPPQNNIPGVLPPPGTPMWIFAGGNIGGGSSIIVRSPVGSCFSLLCSRSIALAGQVDGANINALVFSPLGG